MPTNMLSDFPSPQAQLERERQRIARQQIIKANRALKRQGLEPLPIPDVEPSVPLPRNGAVIALAAFAIFILGLIGLQLLGAGQ